MNQETIGISMLVIAFIVITLFIKQEATWVEVLFMWLGSVAFTSFIVVAVSLTLNSDISEIIEWF